MKIAVTRIELEEEEYIRYITGSGSSLLSSLLSVTSAAAAASITIPIP